MDGKTILKIAVAVFAAAVVWLVVSANNAANKPATFQDCLAANGYYDQRASDPRAIQIADGCARAYP